MSQSVSVGQFAPYSQEAEEAVLGAVLVNPEAFHPVALFLEAEDFYILRHSYIWEAMQHLVNQTLPIDFVTLQEELRRIGHLNDIGGSAYLLHLVNSTPTSIHAETYGELVRRTAVRRRMLMAADTIKGLALDEGLGMEKFLANCEQVFRSVINISGRDRNETMAEIVGRIMDRIAFQIEHPDESPGIPSGYHDLDDLLGGFHKSDLTLIGARPGMGKTSLIRSLILNQAKLGVRIGFASQEMHRDQIVNQILASESDVNGQVVRLGRPSETQWRALVRASGIIGKMPIIIDDANGLTPERLRNKCLRWQAEQGLDILYVDYIQILSSGGQFSANDRLGEVGYFAREMKKLARELNIPVVCAAQLNRGLESRSDKRPQLSDLRETGELEQEADNVVFLYRDSMYNEATEFPNRADLIVAKQRNGPTGTVSLHFEKSTTRFSNAHTTTIDLSQL